MNVSDFAKPVALVTNFVLATYAMVAGLWMPELTEKVSTELILGIASAVNTVYILVQKSKEEEPAA